MKWKNRKHQASIAFDSQKVFYTAGMASRAVFTHLHTSPLGLTPQEAENRQSVYGKNEVVHEKKKKPFTTFIKAFINPFIGVLTILVIISFVLDVLMAEPGEQEWTSIIVISTMVICSAILRFRQEWKASTAPYGDQHLPREAFRLPRQRNQHHGTGSGRCHSAGSRRHDSGRCPHHRSQRPFCQPVVTHRRI